MNKQLRILYLSFRFPFPTIGGDRKKTYFILKHLAKKHDVTFLALCQTKLDPLHIKEVENLGVKVHVVYFNPIVAGSRAFAKLLCKHPLEIAYYLQPAFKKKLAELNPNENFDLVFSFFMRTAEYAKDLNIKKILVSEDCRTVYQTRSYLSSNNILQKAVRKWEVLKLRKYEPEIVNHFDITTLVTNNDIAAMQRQNPNSKYRLLTNGVDIEKFIPLQELPQNKKIIFSGWLSVWANQLMARNIVNNILPEIEKKVPDVQLEIVGANPPQSILALQRHNVSVIANVPDMAPYLQNAQVFLHPHKAGTGIQNKLLEAMASGCSVVTTPIGNQGIDARNGIEAFICNSNEEIIEHTCNLLLDRSLAKTISKNARDLILRTHSWDIIYKQLDDIINEAIK